MPQTESLGVESLHERAAARLRDMVIDGRLAPGQPIDENELCTLFGISRTPLREALKLLAAEGLIELLPRRGAIVAPIVSDQIREIFDVVRLVEDYAIKLVCERATDGQIAELQALHAQLDAHFSKGDTVGFIAVHDLFHLTVVRLSGNETLTQVHAPLWRLLRRARHQLINTDLVARGTLQTITRVMRAIRKRDADRAVMEMESRWAVAERNLVALSGPAATPSGGRAPRGSKPHVVK
jgi:DNA-binding GntR family transcriptional regulator